MMRLISGAAAIGLLAASPASAQDARFETVMPTDPEALAFQEAVGYSDAVIVGDMVYLSGVVAGPAEGETDMAPGFARAFDHIGTILTRAGVSWDDVIAIETFHTDLPGQIETFAEVKNRYIKAPFPTWTALGISALYEPTALVEIKITAHRSDAE